MKRIFLRRPQILCRWIRTPRLVQMWFPSSVSCLSPWPASSSTKDRGPASTTCLPVPDRGRSSETCWVRKAVLLILLTVFWLACRHWMMQWNWLNTRWLDLHQTSRTNKVVRSFVRTCDVVTLVHSRISTDLQQDPCYFRLFHEKWRKQYGDVFTIHVGKFPNSLVSFWDFVLCPKRKRFNLLQNHSHVHQTVVVPTAIEWEWKTEILITGSEPVVILNSVESYREALVTKQNDYAGRPNLYSCEFSSASDIVGPNSDCKKDCFLNLCLCVSFKSFGQILSSKRPLKCVTSGIQIFRLFRPVLCQGSLREDNGVDFLRVQVLVLFLCVTCKVWMQLVELGGFGASRPPHATQHVKKCALDEFQWSCWMLVTEWLLHNSTACGSEKGT